uniref:Mab-21 domain-containing protein n=1 Tax=Glossina austeni TaxID=7395 RepID=A0A1A9VQH4_GLOAU
MSPPFENHLRKINELITIEDKDRKPYTDVYNKIRDTLLNGMCKVDSPFRQMYKGYRLCGSYMHNVRLKKPNEFDVLFILSIPNGDKLTISKDKKRPGFIKLGLGNIFPKLSVDMKLILNELVTASERLLIRTALQMWLCRIIKNVLKRIENRIQTDGRHLQLKYLKTGVAHTIHARDVKNPHFSISIDFIPAIAIKKVVELANECDVHSLYAVPKPFKGKYLNCPGNSFQLVNPDMEHKLLMGKQHLKVVYRLLKSLRDRHRLDRLKSVFFTSMFLWEIEKRPHNFWHKPIGEIFLEMLKVLKVRFQTRNFPYFWSPEHNLIDILTDNEMADYAEILNTIFCTFKTYPDQQSLTFHICARHFQILRKF